MDYKVVYFDSSNKRHTWGEWASPKRAKDESVILIKSLKRAGHKNPHVQIIAVSGRRGEIGRAAVEENPLFQGEFRGIRR